MKDTTKKNETAAWQAIITGVGGQGVLFVNRILAMAAQEQGLKVLVSEVHGMAQRGGSVISHLRAGNYHSPLVPMGQANLLFAMEKIEALRNVPYLAPQGTLVVNAHNMDFLSAEAQKTLQKNKITVFYADADTLAQKSKAPLNILMLAAAAFAGVLPVDESRLKKIAFAIQAGADNQQLWDLGAGLATGSRA